MDAGQRLRIFVEEFGEMMRHHGRARTRWNHNALAPFEGLEEMPRHRPGFRPVTAIESGLPAAGLLFGKIHLIPEALQHAGHGHSHSRKKLIDNAGNE
jgi:hypothetical protein